MSVIDTATNHVTATLSVAHRPVGVAVSPDGTRVYVAQVDDPSSGGSVSVIDTATGRVTATIHRLSYPWGVAVSPGGTHTYATSPFTGSVSVIDTATCHRDHPGSR